MNVSTLMGILAGFLLIVGAIVMGGNASSFINPQAMLIVVGGTLAATLVSFSLERVSKLPALLGVAFSEQSYRPYATIEELVELTATARAEGLLALEDAANNMDSPFLRKGLMLVVDGIEPELVREIMETELGFLEERHQFGIDMFDQMGSLSPAFGMIGTLIGLIQMLAGLDNRAGLATALVTTLYGTLLANLLFVPLAGQLRMKNNQEVIMKEVMLEGILSIQAGDNPRIVREKLVSFLTQAERETEIGAAEGSGEYQEGRAAAND